MLVGRVINGNFFRSTKRGNGRKGCRDVVGAVIVVDGRKQTTMKENVIEISRFLVQDVKTLRKKTDNGTRKCLFQLIVIIAAMGGDTNKVGRLWGVTVSVKQLKFDMFLFGVGVGFGETREVTKGDGVRKGWVQFVEGDNSRFDIVDAAFRFSNVVNPAMLDLGHEVHRFEFLNKDQSIGSCLAHINQVMSEPACNRVVDIFVIVHEPVQSVAPDQCGCSLIRIFRKPSCGNRGFVAV